MLHCEPGLLFGRLFSLTVGSLWRSLSVLHRPITEPDTEICAANSLHSHSSVWCHNWRTIDLCLLLQRPEWLMSGASCHNRPCPGLVLLGCSPHSFLPYAICCGCSQTETMLISILHGADTRPGAHILPCS